MPELRPAAWRRPAGPVLVTTVLVLFVLMVGAARAESLRLAWDPPSGEASVSYAIEHGTSPGTYTTTTKVGVGITTSVVSGLTAGKRYYFIVRAVDTSGVRSAPSNEISAVAPTTDGSGGSTTDGSGGSTTVAVASEAALQRAVGALQSKTTIVLATGTYQLTRPLVMTGGLQDVVLKSSSGRASDVILLGPVPTSTNPKPGAIVASRISRLTIADITIRKASGYAILLGADVVDPLLARLRIVGGGEFVQALLNASGVGAARGIIEGCTFQYAGMAPNFPVGVDVRGGAQWTVRNNRFVNPSPTATQLAGAVLFFWLGSTQTIVEANVFVNTSREIVLGLDDRSPDQSVGGIVRNNMISRKAGTGLRGPAISILDSPDTVVVHNSVLVAGTSAASVEYAHGDTYNVYIANNLLDAPIQRRDGASGSIEANLTTATSTMFVAPAGGDLRLRPDAGVPAIDRGIYSTYAPRDFQGDLRPNGGAVDIGADEAMP